MAALPKGMIVYASTDCREAFDEAKEMITARGWTQQDVRIVRDKESRMLLVETLRPC